LFCSFANDNRFVFAYSDSSFRPNNNQGVCIGTSPTEKVSGDFPVIELNTCSGNHQQWTPFRSSKRQLVAENRTLQGECQDEPFGWYDTYGKQHKQSFFVMLARIRASEMYTCELFPHSQVTTAIGTQKETIARFMVALM
jgi:hypothetical protein